MLQWKPQVAHLSVFFLAFQSVSKFGQIDIRPDERIFQEESSKVYAWTKRQLTIVPSSFHVSIWRLCSSGIIILSRGGEIYIFVESRFYRILLIFCVFFSQTKTWLFSHIITVFLKSPSPKKLRFLKPNRHFETLKHLVFQRKISKMTGHSPFFLENK